MNRNPMVNKNESGIIDSILLGLLRNSYPGYSPNELPADQVGSVMDLLPKVEDVILDKS